MRALVRARGFCRCDGHVAKSESAGPPRSDAALVFVEIGILFAGVVWRYLLDGPLGWSGELAGVLFLWLVGLGAVTALHQRRHMRMTIFLSRLTPETRDILDRIAALATAIFAAVPWLSAGILR